MSNSKTESKPTEAKVRETVLAYLEQRLVTYGPGSNQAVLMLAGKNLYFRVRRNAKAELVAEKVA